MRQVDLLAKAFDEGRVLTVGDALREFGIYALSQRCGELRSEGYPVVAETVKLPNGKRIAQYRRGGIAHG